MRLAILHGLRLLQALNDTIERKNFRCDSDRLRVPKGLVDRCDTAALVRMRPLIGGPEAEAAGGGPPTPGLPEKALRLGRFSRARPGQMGDSRTRALCLGQMGADGGALLGCLST